jgi:hypothetical protein
VAALRVLELAGGVDREVRERAQRALEAMKCAVVVSGDI